MMHNSKRTGALVILLTLAMGVTAGDWNSTARAGENPQVNVNFFRPSVHPRDILGVQTSFIPKSSAWGAGLWMTLQGNTLTLVDPSDNAKIYDMVQTRFMMDLVGSFGIGDWVDVGISLPLAYTAGESPAFSPFFQHAQGFDLGDMRLAIKAKLFPRRLSGFGLGLAEDVSFPTASKRNFYGDKGATATTRVVLDYLLPKNWLLALNVGYRAKQDVRLIREKMGDHILLGFGVVGPVYKDIIEVLGTVDLRTAANAPFGSEYHDALDLMAGARVDLAKLGTLGDRGHMILLTAAAGTGVLDGYGTPSYQATLGLTYMFQPKPTICEVIEDRDKDRDEDGVLDKEDKCPLTPGLMAFAGCPDTDGDGIPDNEDQCPKIPGPAATGGCPDQDADGVRDAVDNCIDIPGPAELGGCPDRDGDGIFDPKDKCPDKAGPADNDGCPIDVVEAERKIMEIADLIYFRSASAELTPGGRETVKNVAKIIKNTEGIKRIRIEGHTDQEGPDAYNKQLSLERVKTVQKALIKQGIDASMLETVGFGKARPVDTGGTKEGRAKNRRVEFIILD